MEKHRRPDTFDGQPKTKRNFLLLGLWMRGGFIGAAFAVAGFASLIDPPQGVSFLTALTWLFAGGTFAWLAWQRTTALLDRIDTDEPAPSDRDDASKMRPIAHVSALS